ncbi:MAG: CPBP family intramembrane metalloprotease [Lachnospiraceae bacterium]|nr:CPBP family intramembrane metalloprotease [Lachnospiraceae bacterium]MDD7146801.1 CPBP family intramembrane metalloprotease [Lachnospiraceae bacterium]
MRKYVVKTYLTFWVMVLGICGTASMVFHAPPLVMRLLSNLCAWSPTIVLAVIWRRLRKEQSFGAFVRHCFEGKIKPVLLLAVMLVVFCGVMTSAALSALTQGREAGSYLAAGGYPLIASFFLSLTSGPTGEELGWRGYLREELAKKYSFVKSALIQGTVWAFWHTVLWFVDSDFTGFAMIPYVLANVIVMCCLAIIMNTVLEKYPNLLYAVGIHFAFNFAYCFLQTDILFYMILCVVFVIIAGLFLILRKKGKEDI